MCFPLDMAMHTDVDFWKSPARKFYITRKGSYEDIMLKKRGKGKRKATVDLTYLSDEEWVPPTTSRVVKLEDNFEQVRIYIYIITLTLILTHTQCIFAVGPQGPWLNSSLKFHLLTAINHKLKEI